MAAGPRLARDRLGRFRALGVQGEPAWRQAGQIRAALLARLTQEHADLLAMPQVDESGETIDWYAPIDGAAMPAASLSPEDRVQLQARADRLREDIQAISDRLGGAGNSDAERSFSRLLRQTLTTPGPTSLWSVGGRPVVVFWGFAPDPSQPIVAAVPALAPAAGIPAAHVPPPPPAATPPAAAVAAAPAILGSTAAAAAVPETGRDLWKIAFLALLLLLLLAFGAWLIKPYLPMLLGLEDYGRRAAAVVVPPSGTAAGPEEAGRQAALTRVKDQGDRLQREFVGLGGDLGRRQSSCAPGATGRVIGPAGEIVVGDGRVVGRVVVTDDGKLGVIGSDGKPLTDPSGKPADAAAVVEKAAREAPPDKVAAVPADAARIDGAKTDGAKADGAKTEGAKAEGGKMEPGKPDGEKPELGKTELGKTEPGKTEPGKPDGARPEAATGEIAKAEPPKPEPGAMRPRGTRTDMAGAEGQKPEPAKPEAAKPEPARPDGQAKGGEAAKPPARPTPAKPEQAKIEKPLAVPADSQARRDVAFLQGNWKSSSTLTTQRGQEEIRINYEFDNNGKGRSLIAQGDGVTCEAPATARFDPNGKLLIEEQANPRCSDGSSYVRSTVTCEMGSQGVADCAGRNDGGKTYSVQIGK